MSGQIYYIKLRGYPWRRYTRQHALFREIIPLYL